MDNLPELEISTETNRLLSELDLTIGQSWLVREIVNKCEYLHSIERMTGPSLRTKNLRQEIECMKVRLKTARSIQHEESPLTC